MIRLGTNYEGRDPRFVETVLPFAEVVEVTPDAVATLRDGKPVIPEETLRELRGIAARAPVILHGIGLSIASADAMSDDYLRLADTLMEALDPAWHSEHLGYVAVDGAHLGTMLVPPRTEETLDLICRRVETVLRRYAKPFLLEHAVNLFPDAGGDYTPAGFLNEIVRRTGCGLLLDIYNLECDAHNGAGAIDDFLDEIDLDAIRELHVACGTEDRGLQVDVHSRVTRAETVARMQRVLAVAPNVEAVIFELLGPSVPALGYAAIAEELQRLRLALRNVEPRKRQARKTFTPTPPVGQLSLRAHQRAMRSLLSGDDVTNDPYVVAAAGSIALDVTRDTIRGWRRFRLDRHCRLTTTALRHREHYDEVLATLEGVPASPYIETLSETFLDAAARCGDELVAVVATFEKALLREDDAETAVAWPCDPYPILGALLLGEAPPTLPPVPHLTVVSPKLPGRFRVETPHSRQENSAA